MSECTLDVVLNSHQHCLTILAVAQSGVRQPKIATANFRLSFNFANNSTLVLSHLCNWHKKFASWICNGVHSSARLPMKIRLHPETCKAYYKRWFAMGSTDPTAVAIVLTIYEHKQCKLERYSAQCNNHYLQTVAAAQLYFSLCCGQYHSLC